jgi:Ca2+-binding RTX toxin-like protein
LGGNDRIELPARFTVGVFHPLNSDVREETTISFPALLEGSRGNDTIFGSNAAETLVGGRGNDYLVGRGGDDHLSGGVGHDRLYGQDGDDLLEGNDGHDRLSGGAGADQLLGGGGRDRAFADDDDITRVELIE